MDYSNLIFLFFEKANSCDCFSSPRYFTVPAKMPQLNGGGGDDLGANDEMISFKDEGEQEEKISENVSAERDLDDVKSSLVNESESSSDSEVRTLKM